MPERRRRGGDGRGADAQRDHAARPRLGHRQRPRPRRRSTQVLGQPVDGRRADHHPRHAIDTTRSPRRSAPRSRLQAGENYNLTQVTVNKSVARPRSPGLRVHRPSASSATATAAHRPRDVCIVLDYSGSMNNESDLWNNESYLDNGQAAPNNPNKTSNNAETRLPQVRPLQQREELLELHQLRQPALPRVADGSNPLGGDTADRQVQHQPSPALGVPAMVNDFWSNAGAHPASAAFTAVADGVARLVQPRGGRQVPLRQQQRRRAASRPPSPTSAGAARPRTPRSRPAVTSSITGTATPRATPRGRGTGARPSSSGPPTRPTTGGRSTSAPTTTPSSGTPAATGATRRATTRSITRRSSPGSRAARTRSRASSARATRSTTTRSPPTSRLGLHAHAA